MKPYRIALAHLRVPESPEASVEAAVAAIVQAGERGARIVAFPESFVPGYRTSRRALPPPDADFLESAWTRVAEAAGRAGVAVVLGTERVGAGPVLSALVIGPDGERIGFQDKVQLDPSEEPTYAPGHGRRVFAVGDVTVGVAICHEGFRHPETVRWAVLRGASIVFHPHFHEPVPGRHRPTFHESAQRCRAAENTCYFASINAAMAGAPTTSCVVDPEGDLVASQPHDEEALLVADLDLSRATGLLARRFKPTD